MNAIVVGCFAGLLMLIWIVIGALVLTMVDVYEQLWQRTQERGQLYTLFVLTLWPAYAALLVLNQGRFPKE